MKKNQLRLNDTLRALIDEFIETNEPVSSRILNERYLQDVSSATLRLDLLKLEQHNLIYQPHTSAGRIPTIRGYRQYLEMIRPEHERVRFERMDILRDLLIHNYKDTPRALHYIMQMLAKETDQLSFVAEPEVSNGYLEKLEVFQIGNGKLLFVMSLDSGLDKTVILKCAYDISESQLRRLVRYLNDELVGLRIYDIANKVLIEMRDNMHQDNQLVSSFLQELHRAFVEISDFFIHYDGSIKFLEQPEFDTKESILSFMNLIQRQDTLLQIMQANPPEDEVSILMGEDLNNQLWQNFAVIYGRYEVFGIPGFLGVISPIRTEYRRLIPLIRDITRTITITTRKGMIVPK